MPHLTALNVKILLLLLFILNSKHALSTNLETNLDYAINQESFDIPGHGELIINVPGFWNYNFTIIDNDRPPLITFYNLDKNKKEIFQLNMSVLWEDGFSRTITSPEYIRSLVQQTGKNTLAFSDQSELSLIEITGRYGIGFFI